MLGQVGFTIFLNIYKNAIKQCYLKIKNWYEEFSKYNVQIP